MSTDNPQTNGWFEKQVVQEVTEIKDASRDLRAAPKPGEGQACNMMREDLQGLKTSFRMMGWLVGIALGIGALLGVLGASLTS